METSHKTSPVSPCCRWFWSEKHWKRTYGAFKTNSKTTLQGFDGLEWAKYVRLTNDWDYGKREVHLAMPGYLQNNMVKAPTTIKTITSTIPPCPPEIWTKKTFSWTSRHSNATWENEMKFIQEVIGTFLFYTLAIYSMTLTALSANAADQANPTTKMLLKTKQFLD